MPSTTVVCSSEKVEEEERRRRSDAGEAAGEVVAGTICKYWGITLG